MKSRIFWIDLLKTVAIFAVVLLHSAAPLLYRINHIDIHDWITANVFDSSVRMSVPLFFMLSGALLLTRKNESLKTFFKKRFLKVVFPLFLWSAIYIAFQRYILGKDIDILLTFLSSLNQPVYYHLWFLYAIIGLYLFVPILRIFVHHSSFSLQLYFCCLWVIATIILPTLNYFTGWHLQNYLPMMTGYTGYLLLGYMLSSIIITRRTLLAAGVAYFFGTIAIAYGTYELSIENNRFINILYSYTSLFTLFQAIGAFLMLKYLGEKLSYAKHTIVKLITLIGKASLGIYLIHPIVLYALEQYGLHNMTFSPIFSIPLLAIVTFLGSFMVIYLIQSFPIGKRIVP